MPAKTWMRRRRYVESTSAAATAGTGTAGVVSMGGTILQKKEAPALAGPPWRHHGAMAKPRRRRALLAIVLLALVTGGWLWAAYRTSGERLPPGAYAARTDPHWTVPPGREEEIRADALARAQVW